MKRSTNIKGAALLAVCLALNGCGGSGSNTPSSPDTVSGLTIASKVSVVDAKSAGQGPSGVASLKKLQKTLSTSVPANSDYAKDKTFIYVNDRSIEAFSTPNNILCMVAQTRHADMVNKGPYKALIDTKSCGENNGQSSGQAAGAPSYASWTVEATRTDASSPEVVKVWVHESDDKVIFARADISASASDSNPLGLFSLNYAGYPAVNGVPSGGLAFKGGIKTEAAQDGSGLLLKYVDSSDGGLSAATLNRSADGNSGTGTLVSSQNPNPMNIAYNADLFHRTSGSNDKCLSRNDFDISAWQYGLYDATTGDRINRNSGFPIRYTKNGKTSYGYVGYWGVWTQDGSTLPNGSTVYKQSSNGGDTPYTVFTAPGKLVKHTRKTLSLADIKGIPLTLFDNATRSQHRVVWDGTSFMKDAVMVQSDSGQVWQDLNTPQAIPLTALDMSDISFYSDSLGGDLQVKLQGCAMDVQSRKFSACTASDNTPVVFYSRTMVTPGDTVPAHLACASNCPNTSKIAQGTPFPYDEVGFQQLPPTSVDYFNYSFDPDTLTLMDKAGVAVTAGTGSLSMNGLQSGPLFDPTVAANLDSLACSFGGQGENTCGWQTWGNLAEFYTWETGSQSWQHFSTLKSDSGFLTFQQPLQVLYAHTGDGYSNSKFFLQYNGFGDLQGIPGKCVDPETGNKADCSQQGPGSSIRWVPQFSILEGETVSDSKGTAYLVKPLQAEERMKPTTGCSTLPVSSYATPDISLWVDPGKPTEPTITAAPSVIGGVLQ